MENAQGRRLNPIHGNIYQLKLLMLFLWRGVCHQYSFHLRTEVKEANKFDDLIFEYIKNGKKVYRLLQAKHKLDESKKITAYNLLAENNSNYNLIKYFLSYCNSKSQALFKDGLIKDITICTNINFNFDDLEKAGIGIRKIKDKDDILDTEYIQKESQRYQFSQDVADLLKPKIQDYIKSKSSKGQIKCSNNEIKDFLNHLVFAVNQPNEDELGKIIKEEIGKEFDFITTENVYNKFFMTMLDWLQGKEGNRFISYKEGKEFFDKVRMGFPIWFNMKNAVKSFGGRVKELDHLHTVLQTLDTAGIAQPVSIHGLGGVGKSELARKYASQYSESYDNKVVWIHSETYEALAESFRRLACDILGISTKNADGKEKAVSSIIEDVYKFLSQGRSLFIFDNAEKYRSQTEFDHGIDKFLPTLPPNCNRPYIIITSRNQKWPKDIRLLQLDVFSEDEAIDFIKTSLNIENSIQENDIKELTRHLHFLPLALQQALAYIREQEEKLRLVGSKFEICNYLERYREKAKVVLNFEFPEDSDNDYSKTVFTTWNVTLDMIKQKENGNFALEILHIISYLASEHISIDIFSNLISNKEELASAIELIKRYSMVNLEGTVLNVHRLVQRVIRMQLQEQNMEEKVLIKILQLFMESPNLMSKNVDHALSVWNYVNKCDRLVKAFLPLSSQIACELTESLRYEEAYLLGKRILKLLSKIPLDDVYIIMGLSATLNNIGHVLQEQHKYDMALNTFQEALNVISIVVGHEHPECLTIQSNIALVFVKQGKLDIALQHYQRIFDISRNVLGDIHPNTLLSKRDIGGIFFQKGQYAGALQILQEVYNGQKATLGKNHFETLKTKSYIAAVLLQKGKYDEGLQMLEDLSNEPYMNKNNLAAMDIKTNIAGALLMQGNMDGALEIYNKAINTWKGLHGESHPEVSFIRGDIAEAMNMQGQYDKALEICQDILDKEKGSLGSDHWNLLHIQLIKADVLRNQGKYDDALEIYQDLFKKYIDLIEDNHPLIQRIRKGIAEIYFKQTEYDKALENYQKLLSYQRKSLGENHKATLSTTFVIVLILYYKNENEKALEMFQNGLDVLQTSYRNNPEIPHIQNNIGTILLHQGKPSEALTILRKALHFAESKHGEGHPFVISVKANIASAFLEQEKFEEALEIFQEVLKGNEKNFGLNHPETARIRGTVNSLLERINNPLIEENNCNIKVPRNLIEKDVDAKDNDGRTQLHYAVNDGKINDVITLLKNGADVTQVTNKGNTPLHTATSKGFKEIVKILLQHVSRDKLNAYINAGTTVSGTTALHVASQNGCLEIVKCLLEHGATWNVKNKQNQTPIDVSKNQNVIRLLKLVEELFIDAKNGNVEVISKLRLLNHDEFKAITGVRNIQGNTLLQVVISHKHKNIAGKLVNMLQKSSKC